MQFIKRHWRWLLIIAVLLTIGYFWNKNRAFQQTQAKIKTVTVGKKTLTENVTSSGKIQAKEQADLHFLAGGKLSWVGVKEGDSVQAYQALASLDTQELQKNLEKALRDYSKERNDFEEDKNVTYKDKALTDTAKRILEKNQWDLEKAVMDVELKTIVFQWTTLVSPIAGVVTRIDTPVAGVNVAVTDTFSVENLTSLVFSASVDETDVGKVSLGQQAEVELDAYPNEIFTGKVTKIAYAAETSSGGATVFPVEISFVDTSNLRIGLNGDVTIKYKESPNTISIPQDSLKENKDQLYVVIKTGNSYQKQQVVTGIKSDDEIEILEGLTEGSLVVNEGFQFLPKNLQ